MFSALIILAIGIIIGWNWPQPPWARDAQAKTVAWVRSLFSK
ncbi:hypothetical protein [Thiococcus pfennigii]|jgi:hypothetical protein|nr:hypothetical protein [Thiococcus pfennigii]